MPLQSDAAHGFLRPVQGLGEKPAGVLVGTLDGRLGMAKRTPKVEPLRRFPDDQPRPSAAVYCMAATDQLVVTGSDDGALRVLRMVEVTD
jgi:hypothetical protein